MPAGLRGTPLVRRAARQYQEKDRQQDARVRFTLPNGEIEVNIADRTQLAAAIRERWADDQGFALATLNLDHLVKLRSDPAFLSAYQSQDFIVADGWPVVWLSRIARHPVALMPGSDLVLPLARLAAADARRVALVGSTDAALGDAATVLTATIPNLVIGATIAPSMDFDPAGPEADGILERLVAADISLCFLALGAPRQERCAARGRALAPRIGFASIGAGLDFLGGHQRRAPELLRRLRLEWLWRALGDPRRLGPRYARCAAILPDHLRAAWQMRRAD